MKNQSKYQAIWIPTGENFTPGIVCIDNLGVPYRLIQNEDQLIIKNEIASHAFDVNRNYITPVKLYLCDRNKHIGGRIYNPVTKECFECSNEFYISGNNDMANDWNVVGAIDPSCYILNFTPIEEENIEGYMFGGGEDQLGYFVLRDVAKEYHVKLP